MASVSLTGRRRGKKMQTAIETASGEWESDWTPAAAGAIQASPPLPSPVLASTGQAGGRTPKAKRREPKSVSTNSENYFGNSRKEIMRQKTTTEKM